ncbi:hypothetical protein EK21DRAFT_118199 [Setomelanomma holmii]|uniref:Uncharacterized protein n=1 Tax=Setomelanomma holmii TaxID=210430 RepID=A0A9P4LF34_9PLEO|nr:hypothetical protein EK21DRAFT_118199 [Setomelanomma holmii]
MENNAAEILLSERRQEAQALNSAPDIEQYRGLYRTRLVLRVLSFATCVAIIAVLIDSVRTYSKTKHVTNPFRNGSGQFPVWPDTLKLYPSYMLLGAGLVAGVVSLFLIVASFNKNVRRMTKTGNVTTMIVSAVCLVVWVVVTAYYGSWDTKKTNWDLLSWTCKHQDPAYDYKNIDFGEICIEMPKGLLALIYYYTSYATS